MGWVTCGVGGACGAVQAASCRVGVHAVGWGCTPRQRHGTTSYETTCSGTTSYGANSSGTTCKGIIYKGTTSYGATYNGTASYGTDDPRACLGGGLACGGAVLCAIDHRSDMKIAFCV